MELQTLRESVGILGPDRQTIGQTNFDPEKRERYHRRPVEKDCFSKQRQEKKILSVYDDLCDKMSEAVDTPSVTVNPFTP